MLLYAPPCLCAARRLRPHRRGGAGRTGPGGRLLLQGQLRGAVAAGRLHTGLPGERAPAPPACDCRRQLLHCMPARLPATGWLAIPGPRTIPRRRRLPPSQAVRELAAHASSALGLRVYPFSPFHIFFEQYLTIGGEALTLLSSGAQGAGVRFAWPGLPAYLHGAVPRVPRLLHATQPPTPPPSLPRSLRGHLADLPGRHGQPVVGHAGGGPAGHAAGRPHGLHGAGRHPAQRGCVLAGVGV